MLDPNVDIAILASPSHTEGFSYVSMATTVNYIIIIIIIITIIIIIMIIIICALFLFVPMESLLRLLVSPSASCFGGVVRFC